MFGRLCMLGCLLSQAVIAATPTCNDPLIAAVVGELQGYPVVQAYCSSRYPLLQKKATSTTVLNSSPTITAISSTTCYYTSSYLTLVTIRDRGVVVAYSQVLTSSLYPTPCHGNVGAAPPVTQSPTTSKCYSTSSGFGSSCFTDAQGLIGCRYGYTTTSVPTPCSKLLGAQAPTATPSTTGPTCYYTSFYPTQYCTDIGDGPICIQTHGESLMPTPCPKTVGARPPNTSATTLIVSTTSTQRSPSRTTTASTGLASDLIANLLGDNSDILGSVCTCLEARQRA